MSRMNGPSAGGFGGPRLVKPQANVYTVLLLAACLFMAAALLWEAVLYLNLRNSPAPGPVPSGAPAAAVVAADSDRPA